MGQYRCICYYRFWILKHSGCRRYLCSSPLKPRRESRSDRLVLLNFLVRLRGTQPENVSGKQGSHGIAGCIGSQEQRRDHLGLDNGDPILLLPDRGKFPPGLGFGSQLRYQVHPLQDTADPLSCILHEDPTEYDGFIEALRPSIPTRW